MTRNRKYKMVRIPEDEYETLLKAKREIMRKGLDRLPDEVFSQNEEDEDGDFTLGLLVGLGAAALVYLLTRNKQQQGGHA